jgi:hypothetical protein
MTDEVIMQSSTSTAKTSSLLNFHKKNSNNSRSESVEANELIPTANPGVQKVVTQLIVHLVQKSVEGYHCAETSWPCKH